MREATAVSCILLPVLLGCCGRQPVTEPAATALRAPAAVRCLATVPDGSTLVAGCSDGTVLAWRVGAPKHTWSVRGHQNGVHAVAVSPDGRTAVSCAEPVEPRVHAWDMLTGAAREDWDSGTGPFTIHAISWLDDHTLIWVSRDGWIRSRQLGLPAGVREQQTLRPVYALAVHRPTRRVAVAGNSGAMLLYHWGPDGLERIGEGTLPATGIVQALVWDPEGRSLAVAAVEGIGVLDIDTGKSAWRREGLGYSINWSPNGSALVLARPGTTEIVAAEDGDVKATVHGPSSRAVWLPGDRIALAVDDQILVVSARSSTAPAR